jgi:hypothetical protein
MSSPTFAGKGYVMTENNDPLVSVAYIRASIVEDITDPRLNRLIAAGKFPAPACVIGRLRQWRRSDLLAWKGGKLAGWSGHDAGFAERQAAAKKRTEALRQWHAARRVEMESAAA